MSTDGADEHRWPGIEVAIEGEGLCPADVPVRHLAEMLEAAASLFERVAQERGSNVEAPRLVALRTASAAYALRSPDPETGAVVVELQQHVRTRGATATPAIRSAMDRLQKSSKGLGTIRLIRYGEDGQPGEPLRMAPPLTVERAVYEESKELFGVVVAVATSTRGASVRLRIDDGATIDAGADIAIAQRAARFFTRPVRALVTYSVRGDAESDAVIDEIDASPLDADDADRPGAVFADLRDDLRAIGPRVRASDWLNEVLDDDRE